MIVRSTGQLFPELFLLSFGNSCHYALKADNEVILFDPGLTVHARHLPARLQQVGLDPRQISKIFITHLDSHRVGGIPTLKQMYPDIKVVGCPNMKELLESEDELNRIYEEDKRISHEFLTKESDSLLDRSQATELLKIDQIIDDKQVVELNEDLTIQLMGCPGHTEHTRHFFIEPLKALITDDAIGYFRGKELPAPAADFSIELVKECLSKLKDLEINALCLPHFGALTGELVRKHIESSLQSLEDLTNECVKAWEIGVSDQDIKAAISESFYSLESWDPIGQAVFDKSLNGIWAQLLKLKPEA